MATTTIRFIVPAILVLISACTTANQRGTEVTRFHLDEPIQAQPVNIKSSDNNSIEFGAYTDLIAAELAANGFAVSAGEDAAIFIDMTVSRGIEVKPAKRSPVSIGIGGGSFGGNVGVGGGASFPLGGSNNEAYVTRLEIKFVRRAQNAIIWEGRASRESESAPENPTTVMQQMVSALFRNFPGESGKTMVIKDQ